MNLINFANVARVMAGFSKDPSTQVGAVVVDDDGNTLVTGFNGFPRGVEDRPERYAHRETKLSLISHAEANCVAQAARKGVALMGANLIVTALYPCSGCAKLIIQAGIKRVYAPAVEVNPRWKIESDFAALMFQEAGVEVIFYQPKTGGRHALPCQ